MNVSKYVRSKSSSLEKDNKNKQDQSATETKKEKIIREPLPSNINNYKHLIDTMLLTGKEIEFVLQLRGYKAYKKGETEEERLLKKESQGPPSFFQKDIEHYFETKEELNKKAKYRLFASHGNTTNLEHLMSKRVGEKSNPTLLSYETNLRIFPPKCTLQGPSKEWSPPPNNMCLSTSQIPKFLPPLLKRSEINLEKIKNVVARPYDHVYENVSY